MHQNQPADGTPIHAAAAQQKPGRSLTAAGTGAHEAMAADHLFQPTGANAVDR
jgi:hypothetical protein